MIRDDLLYLLLGAVDIGELGGGKSSFEESIFKCLGTLGRIL